MRRMWFAVVIAVCVAAVSSYAEPPLKPVSLGGIPTVAGAVRGTPPAWAVMQRRLIEAENEAAPVYLERFANHGGTLREHGKLDDDYECFNTWPLFYALGGGERVLDASIDAWNAITRQWTYQQNKSVKKEFVGANDMLHLSEGYDGFQYFGLADPSIPENIDRAHRFANFYTGADTTVRNYDPVHRIIRSPLTGSAGPSFSSSCEYVLIYGHASLYPVVKSLEPGWEKNPTRLKEIQRIYDDVVISGDVPMNLAITGLVSHAYILTGDEAYKKWVLGYVDAWMERTKAAGGVIPDNVGPGGIVGEKRGGQWWGGFFGWSGRYSVEMIFNGLITASECATVVSGDPNYFGFLRSQVDVLLDRAVEREGSLLVPYKVGPEGWYDYRPLGEYILSHLWNGSMDPGDRARIDRVRAGKTKGPWEYAYADSPNPPPSPDAEMWRPDGTVYDWNRVLHDLRGNQHRRNEAPHLMYLAGLNPSWPERIMEGEFDHVARAVARIRSGTWQHEWKSQTVLLQNPVFTNGLAQMTTGAPYPCFNGGLLMARVRHFDPDRGRPGLPEDVAALVETLGPDRTVLTLVNTGITETRRVVVQAGAYAEHSFTRVRTLPPLGTPDGKERPWIGVYGKAFLVELPPSGILRLEAEMKRYTSAPTYRRPWESAP